MNLNLSESDSITKFNYRDLMIFILPVLIFGLYLFAYKPGILTVASFDQLHQIATGRYTNAIPIFYTYIVTCVLAIFKRVGFIGLLQILIFSIMWMLICKYHRDDSSKSNEFFLQFIITLVICLIPINAVYSITLSSNVLFSYSLMFLCFLIKVMVDKNGQIDTKLALALALTLAVMSGLNNYGIIIALIMLIVITYYLFKKGGSQNSMFMLISIAILGIFLIASLNFVFDVDSDNLNIHTNDAFEDGVNLKNARSEFLSLANEVPVKGYENTTSSNLGNVKYDLIDSFVNLFRENFILDSLFNNPILYLMLSAILLVVCYMATSKEGLILVYLPILLNTLIMFITGTDNLYSNLLIFYLMAIITVSLYFKSNLNPQDISTMTKRKKTEHQPQTYERQYIPQQQDDYSYIEQELENLTLDDINEMLGNEQSVKQTQTVKQTQSKGQTPSKGESDLIDEILKEIENEKK